MIGVVKIGGAEGNELGSLMSELATRVAGGEKWVLVHGASGIMDRLCRERGVEIRMVTSPSG
ncbi:MAG: uridylate kinase, partial [Clostridia bacterium]|nr:uridylate kinase [Pseudomonadota bacterium]NCC86194.1 uridylate kinase [Clostridia bacterium]